MIPAPFATPAAALATGRINPTPAFELYLLEQPLIPAIALFGVGVVTFWVLNTRGKAKVGGLVALVAIALAGVIVAIASLVTTERERLQDATRELVAAVGANDRAGVASRLDERVRLDVALPGVPSDASRERLADLVGVLHRSIRIDGGTATGVKADTRGPEIGRTLAGVRVETTDAPPGSRWQLDWALIPQPDGSDRWVVTRIEAVMIPGIVGDFRE